MEKRVDNTLVQQLVPSRTTKIKRVTLREKIYLGTSSHTWKNYSDNIIIVIKINWLAGCRLKANCPLVEPGPIGSMPSVGVFLRDLSQYLHEFRRKPRKTPNGYVDKHPLNGQRTTGN